MTNAETKMSLEEGQDQFLNPGKGSEGPLKGFFFFFLYFAAVVLPGL